MISNRDRQQAEKSFRQEERSRDGRKAMTEYEAQALTIALDPHNGKYLRA